MKTKTLVSLFLFACAVLLFTRLDFLVNSELYSYGLRFDRAWYEEYSVLYVMMYQVVIVLLILYSRNLVFAVCSEVFVLTSAQDLVYFGLWQKSFPSGSWTWMPYYTTTLSQIILVIFCMSLSYAVITEFPRFFREYRKIVSKK